MSDLDLAGRLRVIAILALSSRFVSSPRFSIYLFQAILNELSSQSYRAPFAPSSLWRDMSATSLRDHASAPLLTASTSLGASTSCPTSSLWRHLCRTCRSELPFRLRCRKSGCYILSLRAFPLSLPLNPSVAGPSSSLLAVASSGGGDVLIGPWAQGNC